MWSRQNGRYKSLTGCFHQILTSIKTEFVNHMFGERDAELYDSIESIDINIMYLMHITSLEENHKKSSKLGLIFWYSKMLVNFIHIIAQVYISFLPAIMILIENKTMLMSLDWKYLKFSCQFFSGDSVLALASGSLIILTTVWSSSLHLTLKQSLPWCSLWLLAMLFPIPFLLKCHLNSLMLKRCKKNRYYQDNQQKEPK